ncbi:MAG TPA: tetratricopeptide repeat protein, partial [Candidatus Paceibacterota bacterium]|nr:tetratricopeptide repeat protein [Candidatus Paceibacterota bacterium]
VLQNDNTAVKWYTLAAAQGYADAQFNLGAMDANGVGAPQTYETAVKWYSLAAEQGDANAQFNLGLMYYDGEGVLQDYVYAHMWFNVVAFNGDEGGGKARDIVAKKMNATQLNKAQELARECVRKEYKGC